MAGAEISIIYLLIAAAYSIIVVLHFIYLSTPNLYLSMKTQVLEIEWKDNSISHSDTVKDFLRVNNVPMLDALRGAKPLVDWYLGLNMGERCSKYCEKY